MALDVWIGNWDDTESQLAVSFEPEAYYWFIFSLVERLYERHGKIFDPYDGCEFRPNEVHLFQALVDDAEALLEGQPDSFSVHVRTQTEPVQKDLYVEVNRAEFVSFLETLRNVAKQCEQTGKSLHLYGD